MQSVAAIIAANLKPYKLLNEVSKNKKLMKDRIRLFITAFVQILLVALNTYQISHGKWVGALFVGFGISYIWTLNVKRAAFGSQTDRVIYASGAALGTITGLFMSKLLYK